jgi:hypothetical protein
MIQKKWKRRAFLFNIFGCIQFIIITFIAMFYYEGGTYTDPLSEGYQFWYNYFSDLGRIVAHSGNLNIISFVLFTITLSVWGVTQIPFYFVFQDFFKRNRKMRILSILGSFFGIFTGFFFIGIAFTPSDTIGFLHNFFVFLGFGSVFISISLFTITLFQKEGYPRSYAIVLASTSFILIIYYLALFLVPSNMSSTVLFIYVSGQKIIIYTLLICEIYQGYGVLKQLQS